MAYSPGGIIRCQSCRQLSYRYIEYIEIPQSTGDDVMTSRYQRAFLQIILESWRNARQRTNSPTSIFICPLEIHACIGPETISARCTSIVDNVFSRMQLLQCIFDGSL